MGTGSSEGPGLRRLPLGWTQVPSGLNPTCRSARCAFREVAHLPPAHSCLSVGTEGEDTQTGDRHLRGNKTKLGRKDEKECFGDFSRLEHLCLKSDKINIDRDLWQGSSLVPSPRTRTQFEGWALLCLPSDWGGNHHESRFSPELRLTQVFTAVLERALEPPSLRPGPHVCGDHALLSPIHHVFTSVHLFICP